MYTKQHMSGVCYKYIPGKQNWVWSWQAHGVDKYIQFKKTSQKRKTQWLIQHTSWNKYAQKFYFDPLKNT